MKKKDYLSVKSFSPNLMGSYSYKGKRSMLKMDFYEIESLQKEILQDNQKKMGSLKNLTAIKNIKKVLTEIEHSMDTNFDKWRMKVSGSYEQDLGPFVLEVELERKN